MIPFIIGALLGWIIARWIYLAQFETAIQELEKQVKNDAQGLDKIMNILQEAVYKKFETKDQIH
jgi:uncharacterized membrane protein YciS (DUF1049 family)